MKILQDIAKSNEVIRWEVVKILFWMIKKGVIGWMRV